MNKSILVIGDSHATPEVANDRFSWLANFILERQPDYIVDVGDSADMASLSRFDVGTVQAEGKRYADDLECYHDAQRRIFGPIHEYNNKHTRWKKRRYQPRFIKTRGNHENRITRAANEDPKYFGHISVEDLREREFGWDVYDFLVPVEVEGICFKHYFTSGTMGRPIGGENHAASLVKKNYMSSVCGHSHTRDFWETTDAMGRKRFGLVAGCYFGHDNYYSHDNARYWRGLVYLHDVVDGQAEPEFLAYHYIEREFS